MDDRDEPVLLIGLDNRWHPNQPYAVQLVTQSSAGELGIHPAVAGYTAVKETIHDPRRIAELLGGLARYAVTAHIEFGEGARVRAKLRDACTEPAYLAWQLDDQPVAIPTGPAIVEVEGHYSIFQFEISRASMDAEGMTSDLPRELVRLRRRWNRRLPAPAGAIARFRNGTGASYEAMVADVSALGMLLRDPSPRAGLEPGAALPEIEVELPGEQLMRFTGEVRRVAASEDGVRVGVRLVPSDPPSKARWRAAVSRAAHPRTKAARDYYPAIWRLYERAGYLNLSGKDPDQFEELQQQFYRNIDILENHQDVGCTAVWPESEDGDLSAAISMLKLYQHTWFVYQLAKVTGDAVDGTSSREILRDVHLHVYEHIELDPQLRWLLGYPQVRHSWSRAVHHDLALRFVDTGLACVVRFRALEVMADKDVPLPRDIDVGPATEDEIQRFLTHLQVIRPRAYVEAYDLVPERVSLEGVCTSYAHAGLSRRRQLFAARRNGVLLAVAIAEQADEGLHLFRLLDVVRPFPMVADLTLARLGMDVLVNAVRPWYAERGKAAFCCFLEDDKWLSDHVQEDMNDMGLADSSILSAKLLPEMLEHLFEVTAPRSPR